VTCGPRCRPRHDRRRRRSLRLPDARRIEPALRQPRPGRHRQADADGQRVECGFWSGSPTAEQARATGIFHIGPRRHSLHGQCIRCRHCRDCKACPVAVLSEPGHDECAAHSRLSVRVQLDVDGPSEAVSCPTAVLRPLQPWRNPVNRRESSSVPARAWCRRNRGLDDRRRRRAADAAPRQSLPRRTRRRQPRCPARAGGSSTSRSRSWKKVRPHQAGQKFKFPTEGKICNWLMDSMNGALRVLSTRTMPWPTRARRTRSPRSERADDGVHPLP